MIHYITPASTDKNLGYAINRLIDPVDNDDWICLRDIDTLPLLDTLEFVQAVQEIANSTNHDVIGAMVNRQGLKYLCHDGIMSNEPDINKHRLIAKQRWDMYGCKTIDTKLRETVAGAFMLFKKSTWQKVGGFPEGGISIDGKMIDYLFCMSVQKAGGTLGYAPGLYLFHMYRWGQKDPQYQTRHLK